MDEKRAARIETLARSRAFQELRQELEAAEERFWKKHISDMKLGAAVDQRALDRMLGRLDAIRLLLSQPQRAARILERSTNDEETK